MKISLKQVKIRDLYAGYKNEDELGVVAFGGKLDIRPPYQREFVYKAAQQMAVIHTVMQGFPLNVMYWAVREDGTYEVIDGQQRTISICQYIAGAFSVAFDDPKNPHYFHSLPKEKQDKILDYELMIYVCDGGDEEKLNWFRTINIAGEKLTEQELLNAVYHGTFVTAAKKIFSKTKGKGVIQGKDYMSGSPLRQDYLETALDWISDDDIANYMSAHRHYADADELYNFFLEVINWIPMVYNKKRKEMKNVNWGKLYKDFGGKTYNADDMEKKVKELMKDSDVTSKPGIYSYLLDNREAHLSLRGFDDNTKREVYEQQNGKCAICGNDFKIEEMEGDHIIPWSKGGKTFPENCQMLCRTCNRQKGSK